MPESPSFLKHIAWPSKKDKTGKKSPKESSVGLSGETEKIDLAEKKRQALESLLAEYLRIKKQALKEEENNKIEKSLNLLSQAEALLSQAEKLQAKSETTEQELNEILEQYGKVIPESPSNPTELSATTPEGKEIKFELKEQLEYWRKFYETNHIDWITLPDFISITPDQAEQMKKLMEQGFDKMIIIPENLTDEPTISGEIITNEKYQKLHTLMSEGYTETYQNDNYKNDGSFQGSKDKLTKFRIILTKDIQNLEDDLQLKATKGKSIEQLEADEFKTYQGLSESEYLIYQREYFQRTKKHLDASGYTWLPGSTRPLSGRVPSGDWDVVQLDFDSSGRDYLSDILGCRLAGSFEIGI